MQPLPCPPGPIHRCPRAPPPSVHAPPLGPPVLDTSHRWPRTTGVPFRLASPVTMSSPGHVEHRPASSLSMAARPSSADHPGCPSLSLDTWAVPPSVCERSSSGWASVMLPHVGSVLWGRCCECPQELVGEPRGQRPRVVGCPLPGGFQEQKGGCALPREVSGSHGAETNSGLASSPRSAPGRDGALDFWLRHPDTLLCVGGMRYDQVGVPSACGAPASFRGVQEHGSSRFWARSPGTQRSAPQPHVQAVASGTEGDGRGWGACPHLARSAPRDARK